MGSGNKHCRAQPGLCRAPCTHPEWAELGAVVLLQDAAQNPESPKPCTFLIVGKPESQVAPSLLTAAITKSPSRRRKDFVAPEFCQSHPQQCQKLRRCKTPPCSCSIICSLLVHWAPSHAGSAHSSTCIVCGQETGDKSTKEKGNY